MFVPRASFSLEDGFINEYRDRQPEWGPVGYPVYKRTYALVKDDGTTEEFWETCRRVVEGVYQIQKGHCQRYNMPWSDTKAQRSAQEMYRRMFEFKWLPPGRGLYKMGTDTMFRLGAAVLHNCAVISTADIGSKDIHNAFSDPFTWLMDNSMLGVGIGVTCEGAGKVTLVNPTINTGDVFTVPDTREGWCLALARCLEAYVDPKLGLPEKWDYSKVRPFGAPIRGFGGTASGPEALQVLLEQRIPKALGGRAGDLITSRDIVNCATSVGECVVAGGARRSAILMSGDAEDSDYLRLKDYSIPDTAEWPRWASNNSVIVHEDTDITEAAKLTAVNGEPGFIFLDNARNYSRMGDPPDQKDKNVINTNPCGEIFLQSKGVCVLVETFPHKHTSYEDYQRTLKCAYLYGKTVTLVPSHEPGASQVAMRTRRIGLSQSGIQDSIARIGVKEHLRWSDKGYKYVQGLDEIYSNWLCIPRSIKTTTVKPSGTISKMVGCREGIHHEKSEYILQAIRFSDASPMVKEFIRAGYRVEESINEARTKVVYFPVHSPGQRPIEEISMWEQLELTALMQAYWADNAVSVTIDFDKEKEGKLIGLALEMYRHRLKSVSFLPRTDHGYQQAPKTVITEAEYHAYKSQLKPLDFSRLQTHDSEDKFCNNGVCEVPQK